MEGRGLPYNYTLGLFASSLAYSFPRFNARLASLLLSRYLFAFLYTYSLRFVEWSTMALIASITSSLDKTHSSKGRNDPPLEDWAHEESAIMKV